MGIRELHGIASAHQRQQTCAYQKLSVDAASALHLGENMWSIESMAVGNIPVQVWSDFLSLYLTVDNPAFERFAEDNYQGLLLGNAVGEWLVARLLLHPTVNISLYLWGEYRFLLACLIYQVAEDGVHRHFTGVHVGAVQIAESLFRTTFGKDKDGRKQECCKCSAGILFDSQGITSLLIFRRISRSVLFLIERIDADKRG